MLNSKTKLHTYTYLLALYYLIAPLEDYLTGSIGTLARYMAILVVMMAFIEHRLEIRVDFTIVTCSIMWLMFITIASCLWSIDAQTSFSRAATYLLVPGFALFVGMLPFSDDDYDFITNAAIIGGLLTVVFLYSTGRFNAGGYSRLTLNESNDPNNFAALLLLPMALCLRRTRKDGRAVSFVKLSLAVIIAMVILYTGSRGGIIALAIMTFVFLLLERAYRRISYIVFFLALVFIFLRFVLPAMPQNLIDRLGLQRIMNDMSTNERQRGFLWYYAITNVIPSMRPWGVGAGCAPLTMSSIYGSPKGIHNTYLTMCVEYGVLGLPVFLLVLWTLFRNEQKEGNHLEAALLVGICAVIFFLDSYAKKFFWNVLMLLFIEMAVADSSHHYPKRNG